MKYIGWFQNDFNVKGLLRYLDFLKCADECGKTELLKRLA
jgi:hypothetical protein